MRKLYVLLIASSLLPVAGCQDRVKFQSLKGTPGEAGQPGAPGAGCTVEQLEAGALITCGNTAALVRNGIDGIDGLQGPQGEQGPVGPQGPVGAPGAPSEPECEHGKSCTAPGHTKHRAGL